MTYTAWVIMLVLLNIGQAYIIWNMFKEINKLKDILASIAKQTSSFAKKEKKPPEKKPEKKKPNFWKIFD